MSKSITQDMAYRQSLMKYAEKYGASRASRKYNKSRSYIYFWKSRWNGSVESLGCQSRRPHSHPNQHTETELKLIRDMRRRNPDLGMVELWHRLKKRGYTRRPKSLFRVMRKMGMFPQGTPKNHYTPKPYEQMTYPGQRVQVDVKVVPRRCIADPELRLFGQKLYLSPILDLYSGDIVTYTISDSPNLLMVTTMLEQAFEKIPDNTNLLLHSDQGWHYRHKQYIQILKEKGVRQSMSRKGNCYDNSVMENFFGHLKSELLYLQEFDSLEHFKAELVEYIDYYNNRRIKARLKGLPPAIHRQQALLAA